MKKLSALILAALLLMTLVFAEDAAEEKANDGRVEIEFCVGDEVLIINGEEVAVEKPYVVGEGVTLVPVRVITEAFGAEVGWEAFTKTISLEYPDVSIVLQIGNPTAEINGRAETLLSAPELTENGFTMVPLRFISENFGAEVGYDNETKRITVVKEAAEEGATVEGAIENKYIGDSYYGWSMENPKDMYLDDRSFDGMETYFLDDEDCWIDVCVYTIDEDYDFDDDFDDWKGSFTGYTLMKADKDDSNENHRTMHFQAKNKYVFRDVYIIVTDKYIYIADGGFGVEDCANKDEFMRILTTFKTEFEGDDIYDLSNVKDGMRTYENEDMKFSIDVPESFMMTSYDSAVNGFSFASADEEDFFSGIEINIYSKDSVEGAEQFAKKEQPVALGIYNEDICKISEVEEKQYENFTAYQYGIEVEAEKFKISGLDVYFELGEYVYNISCSVMYDNEDEKAYPEKIISSFTAEELDFDEIGSILRVDERKEGTTTVDEMLGCSFEVPKHFDELTVTSTAALYMPYGGNFAVIVDASQKYNKTLLDALVDAMETAISKTEGGEIVQSAKNKTIGGKTFRNIIYKQTDGNLTSYSEDYFIVEDGILYMFEISYYEIAYSENARKEMTEILRSVKFN